MLRCVFLTLLLACNPTAEPRQQPEATAEPPTMQPLSTPALLQAWPQAWVERLASSNMPTTEGALGRNQAGYSHPRWQNGMGRLADHALAAEEELPLVWFYRALVYGYSRQLPDGGFAFVVPAGQPPATPSNADLASGAAFFMAVAGGSLQGLQQSSWFTSSDEAAPWRDSLAAMQPALQASLGYLKASKELLWQADAQAPNRLLYDALAYYGYGAYLNNEQALQLARDFAEAAMAQTDPEAGYFIEGGGYDSSYNAVAATLALRLAVLMPAGEPLRVALYRAAYRALWWQASRVLPSGEVSTEGNSRVYPGGEAFLGQEKQVSYISVVEGFMHLHLLSGQARWQELAERVAGYLETNG